MRTSCLVFFAILLPAGVSASMVEQADLAGLVRGADHVVLGSVSERVSYWQETRILTRTTVTVEETWVGGLAVGSTVSVLTLGGVVGEMGQSVSGEARLPSTGQVVLFLAEVEGDLRVVGLSQGLFQVVKDVGGTLRVSRNLRDLRLTGSPSVVPIPDSLVELRREVQRLVDAR